MIGRERAREVLASYRDRTIHAIAEARAIGCVTDECAELSDTGWSGIGDEIHQVVDGLCGVLWILQNVLDKAGASTLAINSEEVMTRLLPSCEHGEVRPFVPEGYDKPPGGAYRCGACDEVLVEIKCRHCDIAMLPHQLAGHVAERCWAT